MIKTKLIRTEAELGLTAWTAPHYAACQFLMNE